MPRLLQGLDYSGRRQVSAFVVLVLSLMSLSVVQGTAFQQLFDLHLGAWPIVALRNVFAVVGGVVGIGLLKNWL